MANKLIQELSLQDQGYSSGIKEAIQAVEELAKENGVTTNSIKNVSKEMRAAQRFAEALTTKYAQLSDEAKNTDWGRAIAKEIDMAIQKAGELKDMRDDIARQVNNIASDTRAFDTLAEGVNVLSSSMQLGAGIIGTFTDNEKDAVNMLNLASAAQGSLNTVIALGNALQKESNIMQFVSNVQKKAGAVAINLETSAKLKNTVATKAATVAQRVFNAVAKANPYVLLATAAIAATTAIWAFASANEKSEYEENKAREEAEKHKEELMLVSEWADKTGNSFKDLEKIQKKQPVLWRQMTTEARIWKENISRQQNENKQLGKSIGDAESKFKSLQQQWSRLSTAAEKNSFIKNNKNVFDSLGLSINSVNDAVRVFVKDSAKVLNILKAYAKASAYQSLYEDAIKNKAQNWDNRNKSRDTGDYYTQYTEGHISDEEARAAGVRTSSERRRKTTDTSTQMYNSQYGISHEEYYRYSKEEIDKINAYRKRKAIEHRNTLEKVYTDAINTYEREWDEAIKNAEKAAQEAGGLVNNPSKNKNNKTNTEAPLEKYNNALAEIAAKKKEGLIDEQKAVEAEIDAITEYCNALVKNGDITDKDAEELKKLKPVLKNLRGKLKNLQIAAADQKSIKEANESYEQTIAKLNRDRKEGWIDEDKYTTEYINELKNLIAAYRSVSYLTEENAYALDSYISELNKLQLGQANAKKDNKLEERLGDISVDIKVALNNLETASIGGIKPNDLYMDMYRRLAYASELCKEINSKLSDATATEQELKKYITSGKFLKGLDEVHIDFKETGNIRKDLENFVNELDKFKNSNKLKTDRGDSSNYKVNQKSYAKIEHEVTHRVDVVVDPQGLDRWNVELNNMLQQYKDIEDAMVAYQKAVEEYKKIDPTYDPKNEFYVSFSSKIMDELEERIAKTSEKIQNYLTFQIKLNGLNDAMSGLASIGSTAQTWENLGDSLENAKSGLDKFMVVFNALASTFQSVNTAMEVYNALSTLFSAKTSVESVETAKNTAAIAGESAAKHADAAATIEKTTADSASIAPMAAVTTANKALESSLISLASAQIFAAHAAIPFAGVGISTGLVAQMMSEMAVVHATALSLQAMANGGVVEGNSFYGDSTLIWANKGEMLLNQHQQSNLFSMLDGTVGNTFAGGHVEFRIKGSELVGVFTNYENKMSKIR